MANGHAVQGNIDNEMCPYSTCCRASGRTSAHELMFVRDRDRDRWRYTEEESTRLPHVTFRVPHH